ncbi:MAG: cytochrome P450 [Pseudomonadota bacterium]
MTPLPAIDDFDLRALPNGFYENPYPWYRALQTREPVRRMPDGSVLLTRYADVQAVYKNPTVFSSDKTTEFKPKFGNSALFEHHTTSLVFNDPPLHSRVRRLIAGAMHPRAITDMAPGVVACVDALLDALEDRPEADLIADFAMQIPIEIIGNLLGIPPHDRGPLRGWSLAILGALEPRIDADTFDRGNRAVTDFTAYLDGLTAERRRTPGDPERDVLTRLIQGEAGDTLSLSELLQNCIFILNAGHETTTNLIGNGLVLLAQHGSQRAQLLAEPGLLSGTIDEILRLESSNQLGNRISTRDTEIAGHTLCAGTPVTLCIGAANRDPAQFADPDHFDLRRAPNRHLAFGSGIHQCAGINLAKLEGRVALGRFLQRFPNYRLDGQPTRSLRARFRGFSRIPCRLR